ncbi:MAG: sensor histidine kinase [Eubacteriales bacterium]|nr:sensor histidine kinase [Eubacteriales bacterium]
MKKMIRTHRPRPLKVRLIELIFLLTVCILSVSIYTAWDYKKLQTSVIEENNRLYATQLAKSTRQAYDTYKNICYSVAFNQSLQEYLTETDPLKKYDRYQEQQSYLSNTANLDSYIVDIAVLGVSGNSISLTGAADSYQVLADTLTSQRFSFSSMGLLMVNGIDCHILSMPVHSLSAESPYLGVLFLAIDINRFFENGIPQDAKYCPSILFTETADSEVIYGSEEVFQAITASGAAGDSFNLSVSGTSYTVNHYNLSNIDFDLYALVDQSLYSTQIMQLLGRHFLWAGLIILLIAVMLILFLHPLISSLNRLTAFMKEITGGERKAIKQGITIDQGFFGCTEISNINEAFNDMLRETNQLNHTIFETYTQMYELEMNNRKTEIAFLRSQINPHFLYNTLTSICGMASVGMTDEIITVTNALSQIFRYSIKGSDLVTVAEELEIVKSYLRIQQMRFEGRFTVRYDMDPNSFDWRIPKMVIQPLVENAIVHGLEPSLKKGELLIGSGFNPEHGYLAIWIYDTGIGMPQAKRDQLRTAIDRSSQMKSGDARRDFQEMDAENHDSIGILNVNTRMTLYFGQDYSLILDSEEGVGTNVQLRIPYSPPEAAFPKKEDY